MLSVKIPSESVDPPLIIAPVESAVFLIITLAPKSGLMRVLSVIIPVTVKVCDETVEQSRKSAMLTNVNCKLICFNEFLFIPLNYASMGCTQAMSRL